MKQVGAKFWKLWANPLVRGLASALVLAVMAALLVWFLEYRYFMNDGGRTWQFTTERTLVFWFSAFLVWLWLLLLTAIVRRPIIAGGITWVIIIIITYIEMAKFAVRGTPLLPEDFMLASEAANLTKFVDVWGIVRLVVAIVLVLGLTWGLNFAWRKRVKKHLEVKQGHFALIRVVLGLGAIVALVGMTDFVRHHDGQRYEHIDWLGADFVAWSQPRNYENNGFILGFLYNLQKLTLATPSDYSETAIKNAVMAARQAQAQDEREHKLSSLADADYNIITILNESFYDPELLAGIYDYSPGDIMPTLKSVQEKYPHGTMYSLDYGGGTANIEFEMFTGLTNYWVNTVPYTDLLPRVEAVPSIASWAKENGYTTTAIHAYNGGMYKRNIVLPKEGFDTFVDEAQMTHREKESDTAQYLNDKAIYQEALDRLNNGEGKQLISLITMQNHTPYEASTYEGDLDFTLTSPEVGSGKEQISTDDKQQIETYLQTLHKSDQYLGEFLAELDRSEKKTVVLFFGDHSAGLFSNANDSDDAKVRELTRQTPYFIYANFDLDAGAQELPKTTPNCLANTLYDILKVKKPVINYVTAAACAEEPILTAHYLGDREPKATAAIDNYRLVTYDILGGKQYWMQYTR